MNKFLDTIIGSIDEKKEWRRTEARAKALPAEYATAYKEIKSYIFTTSGIEKIQPIVALVDLFEEAAANKKRVLDITGPDVAAFVDELVRDEQTYFEKRRKKLNANVAKKLKH